MLTRFSRETAGDVGLQFEGEFPPQIEEVHDRAILPEQGLMKSLAETESARAYRAQCVKRTNKSVFLHGVNTMNALCGPLIK
jgi:hypothetical protein